jgi:cyclopropane fatty-acyl-phospholipid synthase-like methyltransferase
MPRLARRLEMTGSLLLALAGCAAAAPDAREGAGCRVGDRLDAVIALLGVAPGDRIAEIGARDGAFASRFAEAVGESGRVYAVAGAAERVAPQRVRDPGGSPVSIAPGGPGGPNLPDGEIDLVFACDSYHGIADRPDYFRRLLVDLSPNGRVAIVEAVDGDRPGDASTSGADAIEREMREAGYRPIARYAILPYRTFQTFGPDDGTGE